MVKGKFYRLLTHGFANLLMFTILKPYQTASYLPIKTAKLDFYLNIPVYARIPNKHKTQITDKIYTG